jgi:hypothetical protein
MSQGCLETAMHRVARGPVTRADLPKGKVLITLPVSKLSHKGAPAPAGWRPVVRHDSMTLGIDVARAITGPMRAVRDVAGAITGMKRAVRHEKDRVRLASDLIHGRSPGRAVLSMGAA